MGRRATWRRGIIGLIIFIITAGTGYAVDLQNLDLATCIQVAMEKDQGLIASEEAVKKAKAVLMQARSAYYPQIMVNSSYIKLDEPINLQNFTLPVQGFGNMAVDRFDLTDDKMVVTEAGVNFRYLPGAGSPT